MKNENAKTENAKNENAKPRRVRMNYKVGELPHVFFNRAAPEGARAGEHASVGNGVLWHERGRPAAAFISDARAADGRPAVVIMPSLHGGRWGPYGANGLQAAVPDTVQHVQLERWPAPLCADGLRGAATCCSVAALFAQYCDAIENDAARSVHSAGDVQGIRPDNLPQYAAAINALLALQWSDAIAQERARVAWEALRARWQLGRAGNFDIETVRAIAQQQLIEKRARDALPTLRDYFLQRENRSKAFLRAALLREKNEKDLTRAIADVLRAGLPAAMLHGLPANMAGTLADDAQTTARINRLHAAPRALSRAWQQAMRGHIDLPGDYRELPERWRVRFDEARDYANRKRARDGAREYLQRMADSAGVINAQWPQLLEYCEQHAAGVFDLENVEACERFKVLRNEINAAAADMSTQKIERARQLTRARAAWLQSSAPHWADAETRAAAKARVDVLTAAIGERETARAWQGKLADVHALLDDAQGRIIETPRAALSELVRLRGIVEGWGWNGCPEAMRRETQGRISVLRDNAMAQIDIVGELDEWKAGGQPPASASGDWLLISGARARTTRGVEVPTRAVRLAFAALDAETETAVSFRERNLMIGSYQLTRRDDDGTVHIGCHAFSAAAVEHARQQLAKIAADKAQESAEVAA